jgi:NhaP-type Na+/H+ and K+/H+ antiporter
MQDFLKKHDVAKTEDLVWLNQFGTIGTFLKMISNSSKKQASKTTVGLSVMFLFYGFLFFTNSIEAYNNPHHAYFAGIFVFGRILNHLRTVCA